MMKKIESNPAGVIWYEDQKLDLYVDWQDPTKFTITDKSITPLLTFECDHSTLEELQVKLNEVMPVALAEWDKVHKVQDQRDRLSTLTTDKNVNIITSDTRKHTE